MQPVRGVWTLYYTKAIYTFRTRPNGVAVF